MPTMKGGWKTSRSSGRDRPRGSGTTSGSGRSTARRTIWVGAADEDIGLKVDLPQLPTHRVAADIDDERDILSGDLEAGGCAVFIGYVSPKGAITSGVNSWGQQIRSDGRAAVLKVGCGALDGLTR